MKITMEHLTSQLMLILKTNAPVRKKPLGAIKYSPYPGNLKNNGIIERRSGKASTVMVGGEPAPYAAFTEKTSHKKGWMQKSQKQFVDMCRRYGGKIR